MKTPQYFIGNDRENDWFSFDEVIGFIELAQKESYNEALEDVLGESVYIGDSIGVFEEEIIKFKK